MVYDRTLQRATGLREEARTNASLTLKFSNAIGPPCERFASSPQAPACKLNKLRWCQTDLGANALRWPRLLREGRRFGNMAAQCGSWPSIASSWWRAAQDLINLSCVQGGWAASGAF